jgi:hypothetical protein
MKYNLINFGYDSWSKYWKRNQTLFYYLYNEDFIHKAYFINKPVWLTDLWHNLKQEISEPNINSWYYVLPKQVDSKNKVITPLILPFIHNSKTTCLAQNNYLSKLSEIENSIAMINYPPSIYENFICRIWENASLKIFDWSDDYEQFTNSLDKRSNIRNVVNNLLKSADIVITINDHLANKASILNKNVTIIRNATNYFMFANKIKLTFSKLDKIQKPIIGYVGWLNKLRLDVELLEYLATQNPAFSFVFIGPRSHNEPLGNKLPAMHNVHILDPVHCSELPHVMTYFDICILPNKINEYTRGNDPLKIYDYLSSGKPIVSTKTSGTEQVKEFLYFAEDEFSFNDQVHFALKEQDEKLSEKRISKGYQNSWKVRYESFINIIRNKL